MNYLLQALSRNRRATDLVEQIQPVFQLHEQSFLSERSLWYRRRPGKRTRLAPVLIEETPVDAAVSAQAMRLLNTEYDRVAVAAYVEQWLAASGICYSKDMKLDNDKAYVMSLLAVLAGQRSDAAEQIEVLDGYFTENSYPIPQLVITRKEDKSES